jgi:hypothetical protein
VILLRPGGRLLESEEGVVKVRHHEGEVVEREVCGPAQGADDGPLLLGRLSGQLVRPSGAVLAVGRPALEPLANRRGGDAKPLSESAGALAGAGDLGADSRVVRALR